jgi:hypothetical protein
VIAGLRVAALVEALTLIALLVNLVTVHWRPVTALGGPLHGTAYLAVIAVVLLLPGAPRAAKLLVLVPGIGGWLALRALPSP